MDQFGFANVTRYPGGDFHDIARNAYGIAGAGSLLIEIRGQTDTEVGQASRGMLVKQAEEQDISVIRSTVDGVFMRKM
ncbi:hypothetical protein [Evansella halocellulosilytica]|uniref:hypothetical protein n=1 Tax=Evansella halocellulosilytica TaxID=2011013 RepID=UPI000BB905A2|nr:hypothetical protein [Evansella halocellulosilytica]